MKTNKFFSGPPPTQQDEQTKKKQLATSILEHLIEEGLVPELSSNTRAPYVQITAPEPETEPDH